MDGTAGRTGTCHGLTRGTPLSFLPRPAVFFRVPGAVGSQFLVNFSAVTDRKDPDDPRFAFQFVNDAESSDFEPPQPR